MWTRTRNEERILKKITGIAIATINTETRRLETQEHARLFLQICAMGQGKRDKQDNLEGRKKKINTEIINKGDEVK